MVDAEVVELVLRGDTVHDTERRRFLEPPHTRSARRVELALATITGASPLRASRPPP